MKQNNILLSLLFGAFIFVLSGCGEARVATPTITPNPEVALLGAGYVQDTDVNGLCSAEGAKSYSSSSLGISACTIPTGYLMLIITWSDKYSKPAQENNISMILTQLYSKDAASWVLDHLAASSGDTQEGLVGDWSITLANADFFSDSKLTFIGIGPKGSARLTPAISVNESSTGPKADNTPSFTPTIDVYGRLFAIRNWLVDIWNDYICNFNWFASNGTDAVGNTDFDAAFAAKIFDIEMNTTIIEYDSFISSLESPNIATLKDDWALVTEQMVIINNLVKGKTTQEIRELGKIDTTKFEQYRDAFEKDVDDVKDDVITIGNPSKSKTPTTTNEIKPTSTSLAGGWGVTGLVSAEIYSLVIDPLETINLYAGGPFGLFMSKDRSQNWTALYNGLGGSRAAMALAIDPVTPTTIYVGTENGVYKSTNGGKSWFGANKGIPMFYIVNSFAIDPKTPGTIYAGASKWSGGGSNSESVVLKSTNSGDNWQVSTSTLKDSGNVILVIDPISPNNVYFGNYSGMYKSEDSGESWYSINSGLSSENILSLAIDPLNPSTLFAGTGGGANGGLFISHNGGEYWTQSNSGLPQGFFIVFSIAVNPLMPTIVYASLDSPDKSLGVFISTNGGRTWIEFNKGLPETVDIFVLAIDPKTPAIVYAGTSRGIFVTQ